MLYSWPGSLLVRTCTAADDNILTLCSSNPSKRPKKEGFIRHLQHTVNCIDCGVGRRHKILYFLGDRLCKVEDDVPCSCVSCQGKPMIRLNMHVESLVAVAAGSVCVGLLLVVKW